MPFDGTVLHAITNELHERLTGGRISKIYQPLPSDLILQIRSKGRNEKLLISANPSFPRIYLTEEAFQNPMEPPMFTMLLRKYLEGGVIEKIAQWEMERILTITISARNEIGDPHTYRLIFELMGKHSNLILLDPDRESILDAIHHVTPAMSRVRVVLPGKTYETPPSQGKKNPLTITKEAWISLFTPWPPQPEKHLTETMQGISPFVARQIVAAGGGSPEGVWRAFHEMVQLLLQHQYTPTLFTREGKSDFTVLPFQIPGAKLERFDDANSLLETYFRMKASEDLSRQMGHELLQILRQEKRKNEHKVAKQRVELREAAAAEEYKRWGELLISFQHEVSGGAEKVMLPNIYEEGDPPMEIPLDPDRSAVENAQVYFRRYQKAKKSIPFLHEQIQKAEEEIAYFDQVILQIEQADQKSLHQIREELIQEKIIRGKKEERNKKGGKRKEGEVKIDRYRSSEGYLIYVGKNNLQNEALTMRIAGKQDTWLHTKEIPGSHVVISGTGFTEKTLHEAAMLAAYFSKGRDSSSVPVDYTLIRYVKKPNGAKPGFVIYDHQKTLYVTPDEAEIRKLQKGSSGKP